MIKINVPHKPTLAEYGLTEQQFRKEQKLIRIREILHSGCFWLLFWCIGCGIVGVFFPTQLAEDEGPIGRIIFKFLTFFWFGFGICFCLSLVISGIAKVAEWFSHDSYSKESRSRKDEKWKIHRENNLRKEEKRHKVLKAITPTRVAYDDYCKALSSYNFSIQHIKKKYLGIEDVQYDSARYSKQILTKYLPEVINYTRDAIIKANQTTNANWWKHLSPEAFEREIASWFSKQGYIAKTTKLVGDGGVDVILEKDGEKTYVQCKHFVNNKVDIKVVRELNGVMASDRVKKGVIACLNGLSSDNAYKFACRNGIKVVDLTTLTNGARNMPITEQDDSMKYMVGDYFIIKDVFESSDDAMKSASSDSSVGISILRVQGYFFIVESMCGDVLEMDNVVHKRLVSKDISSDIDSEQASLTGQLSLF